MNKIGIYIICAAAVLSSPVRSAGQDMRQDDSVYTIDRCYSLVRENYPLVDRYGLLDLTEEYTLKNAYMNYFPQISLSGSASWQTQALEFPFDLSPYGIDLPTFSKDQYAAVLELSQVIWDGGMIAANRANIRAKADVDMAQQDMNMYSLKERVNDLYFGILYIEQQIRQTEILMEDLRREYGRIESCIANGVANASDLDLIEVERITQKQNRETLSSMLEAYLRVLTLMTGVRISSADQLVMPVPEGMDKEVMLSSLIDAEIRRPELELDQLAAWHAGLAALLADETEAAFSVQVDIKYAGYLERQRELVARARLLESVPLPENMEYSAVVGLSREVEEKLQRVRPRNLGQAGRISGVTPAAVSCLEIHLHKQGLLRTPPPAASR